MKRYHSEDPGNGTIPRAKEFRFRIKESDLRILRMALAGQLEADITAFEVTYRDQLFERERVHWEEAWKIRDEIRAGSQAELDLIEKEYLLLYRLVHTGTGRPWESWFDPVDRSYREKARKLIARCKENSLGTVPFSDRKERYQNEE